MLILVSVIGVPFVSVYPEVVSHGSTVLHVTDLLNHARLTTVQFDSCGYFNAVENGTHSTSGSRIVNVIGVSYKPHLLYNGGVDA